MALATTMTRKAWYLGLLVLLFLTAVAGASLGPGGDKEPAPVASGGVADNALARAERGEPLTAAPVTQNLSSLQSEMVAADPVMETAGDLFADATLAQPTERQPQPAAGEPGATELYVQPEASPDSEGETNDCLAAERRSQARVGDGAGLEKCEAAAASIQRAAAGLVVNSGDDVDDGLCDGAHCSLREAVAAANALAGADSISFAIPGCDPITPCTITLAGELEVGGGGLAIDGAGAGIILSGGGSNKIIVVDPGAQLTLQSLSLVDGRHAFDMDFDGGGAVFNQGDLTIIDSQFSGNTADETGGAIFNVGSLAVENSDFFDNASAFGGAIYNFGSLTLSGSSFGNNSGSAGGGAIYSQGILEVSQSSFSSNLSGFIGGAIASASSMTVAGSTFDANNAQLHGGAITSLSDATITNSTFSANTAVRGGAIKVETAEVSINNSTFYGNGTGSSESGAIWSATGLVGLKNTLFGSTLPGSNCTVTDGGLIIDVGGSLSDDASCTSSATPDLKIDPILKDNGGATLTHALLPGSPALDAGVDDCQDALGIPLASDQRGVPRPQGSACDVGAYELVVPTGSIGDEVWQDEDDDGLPGPGEPGVPGVTINLLDAAGNIIASDVTDANGNYLFGGLLAGNYVVDPDETTLPPGWLLTSGIDPLDVSLGTGEDFLAADFGYRPPRSDLSGRAWYDQDQDGIQDADEPGYDGLTVELYADTNCSGALAGTTTSGSAGAPGSYRFAGLLSGDYCLRFTGIPGGWNLSPAGQGSDDSLDSDFNSSAQIVAVVPGVDLDLDLGLYVAGSLGDEVSCASDGSPLANIGVTLFEDFDLDGTADGPAIASTESDAGGFYQFSGLQVALAGDANNSTGYVVRVDTTDPDLGNCSEPLPPSFYAPQLDSDNPDDANNDFSFTIPNRPPEVAAGGPYSGDEGSTIPLDGASASDPEGDPLSYSWTLEPAGCRFDDPSLLQPSLTCDDDGVFRATVRVTDSNNDPVSSTAEVIVRNVAPQVGPVITPAEPVHIDEQPILVTADFTDPGLLDVHSGLIEWGDGSSDLFALPVGSRQVEGNHSYGQAGLYTVRLTVNDDDGGSGESVSRAIVVYDPEAGFVTGGGWFDSPAGSYLADPGLAGKSNFGFVARYQGGETAPSGSMQFQFKAADLRFRADSYAWMVVAGGQAMVQGSGSVDGEGGFLFRLSLNNDGRIRIQIWDDTSLDTLLFDNCLAAPEGVICSPLGGGSLKVHDK